MTGLWITGEGSDALLAVSQAMSRVFIGSEALAAGTVTRYELAKAYQRVFPNVYARTGRLSLQDRTVAAWLWSRRRGVVTGLSASALHGAKWVDASAPIELNLANNKPPRGVLTRNETILEDEILTRGQMAVTTVQRTAFELALRGTVRQAVARLDALVQATGFNSVDVLAVARRHPHVKGLHRVGSVLDQIDSGAESPQETYLRLTLIDAGFPRPRTQIPVPGPHGRPQYYLDMGWPDLMIAVEYDGEHHRTDRPSYVNDVIRSAYLAFVGWIVIRVLADHHRVEIIDRVQRAWNFRLAKATG